MKKGQKSLKSKNDGQLDPFTFGKNDSNKLTQLSNTNKELASDEKNPNSNTSPIKPSTTTGPRSFQPRKNPMTPAKLSPGSPVNGVHSSPIPSCVTPSDR